MRLLLLLFLLVATATSQAQTWQKTNAGIKTTINKTTIEIQFYSASEVRVIKYPDGIAFDKKSLSVIKTPEKINLDIKQQAAVVLLQSESLTVKLNLNSGMLSYFNKKGAALLNEKENSTSFIPFNDAGSNTYNIEQAYVLDK